jgi:NADH:ubiquinone oxidoreductase subunit
VASAATEAERTSVLRWLRANTLGTYLLTRFSGEFVGTDELGSKYYRMKRPGGWRSERRWVVYGPDVEIEGSMVPPGWQGWLNHSREKSPSEEPLPTKRWEKEHQPNLSGSALAYLPPGHERRGGQRAPATGDYEAWRP